MAWGSWRWKCLYPGKTHKMKTYFIILVYLTLINSFVCVSGDIGSDDAASVSSSILYGRRKLLSSEDTSNSIVKSAIKRRDIDPAAPANKTNTSPLLQAVSSKNGKENAGSASPESKSVAAAPENPQPKLKNNTAELKTSGDSKTSIDPSEGSDDDEFSIGPKGLSPDAVLRLFYVFVAVGVIILIYILIKLLRLRRRRASRKYRAVAHGDDQEMFPLAADDGDDEEIYNAADHQTQK